MLCTYSGSRVGPCFFEFAKDFRGCRAEKDNGLLKWGV